MPPQQSITGDQDAYHLALRDAQHFKAVGISIDTVRGRIRKQQHPAAKFTSKSLKNFCYRVTKELEAQNAAQEQQLIISIPPVSASLDLDLPVAQIQKSSNPPAKRRSFFNPDWEPTFPWALMHDVRISMPFLGSFSETHQSRLEKLRLPPNWRHNGMPAPGQEFAQLEDIQLQEAPLRSFDSYQLGGCTVEARSIADMSRLLYHTVRVAAPETRYLNIHVFASLVRRIAVHQIACFVRNSFDKIQTATPIRLCYNIHTNRSLAITDHFALWIQFDNGSHTILPIALWVSGSVNNTSAFHRTDASQNFSHVHREIRAFFQDTHWPMIAISDVAFVGGIRSGSAAAVWQPRVFEDVWYFAPASNAVHILPQATIHYVKPYIGWQRYKDIYKLLTNFTSVARYAYVDKLPSEPFETLSISNIQLTDIPCYPCCATTSPEVLVLNEETEDEFELEAEFNEFHTEDISLSNNTSLDLRIIDDETDLAVQAHCAAHPVDDTPSCAAFFRCTSQPIPMSTFCQVHWERFISLKASKATNTLIPIPSFHLPVNGVKLETLKALIELVDKKEHLWLTDSEFNISKGMAPSAFQVCIKKFGSINEMISTNIYYPGFDLAKYNKTLNPFFPYTFQRIYGSDRQTNGITLPQLGARLRESGFDYENDAMLSWFSMADITTIVRALRGHTSMLEGKENVRIPVATSKWRGFQPINIGDIVRSMINLQWYNLQHVHRAFCPESTLRQFHTAKTDVLALEEIISVVVRKGKELLQ